MLLYHWGWWRVQMCLGPWPTHAQPLVEKQNNKPCWLPNSLSRVIVTELKLWLVDINSGNASMQRAFTHAYYYKALCLHMTSLGRNKFKFSLSKRHCQLPSLFQEMFTYGKNSISQALCDPVCICLYIASNTLGYINISYNIYIHFFSNLCVCVCLIHFNTLPYVLIPGLHPANERRRYKVTTSLIGRALT